MERKLIYVPAEIKGHTKPILESNGAEFYGYTKDKFIEESKYHSNGNYKEVALIGEFAIDYSESLSEEVLYDEIKDGRNILHCQILVYSNEGPVPHFHIKSKGNEKIDICICIFEARYFDHGSHVSTFNSKELKILDSFLRNNKIEMAGITLTYWNNIVLRWNDLNPDNYKRYPNYVTTDKQPDYTHMLGYKSGR